MWIKPLDKKHNQSDAVGVIINIFNSLHITEKRSVKRYPNCRRFTDPADFIYVF